MSRGWTPAATCGWKWLEADHSLIDAALVVFAMVQLNKRLEEMYLDSDHLRPDTGYGQIGCRPPYPETLVTSSASSGSLTLANWCPSLTLTNCSQPGIKAGTGTAL
jgi:hypothetical protein